MRDPHTLALAILAVESTSKAEVARRIGFSRTAVSQYIDDKYPASPAAMEQAIRAHYDTYLCPHTQQEINGEDCQLRASMPKPLGGGRAKEAHWAACQACPRNLAKKE